MALARFSMNLQLIIGQSVTYNRIFLRKCARWSSLAGGNPRDYGILQVFLQTGIRVSELANLTVADVDFTKPAITVRGKGNTEREIALEKRGVQALKNYLAVRPENLSDILFLNYKGEPISERGIRKLVVKYRKNAGITKRASCQVVYLSPADKYPRLTRRLSQDQKGIGERALMAS